MYDRQNMIKLRNCYNNIKQRCMNPKCPAYPSIGGRGIRFRLGTFTEFVEYCRNVLKVNPQGKRLYWINPSKDYTLDNIVFVPEKRRINPKRKRQRIYQSTAKYPIALCDMK